jgi:hypothetical protein
MCRKATATVDFVHNRLREVSARNWMCTSSTVAAASVHSRLREAVRAGERCGQEKGGRRDYGPRRHGDERA